MPEFQSNHPKKPHASFRLALYVIGNLTKIGPLIYFFENVNRRCRDERRTIGILKAHMIFWAHVG